MNSTALEDVESAINSALENLANLREYLAAGIDHYPDMAAMEACRIERWLGTALTELRNAPGYETEGSTDAR